MNSSKPAPLARGVSNMPGSFLSLEVLLPKHGRVVAAVSHEMKCGIRVPYVETCETPCKRCGLSWWRNATDSPERKPRWAWPGRRDRSLREPGVPGRPALGQPGHSGRALRGVAAGPETASGRVAPRPLEHTATRRGLPGRPAGEGRCHPGHRGPAGSGRGGGHARRRVRRTRIASRVELTRIVIEQAGRS
jgi:hypothetical protein